MYEERQSRHERSLSDINYNDDIIFHLLYIIIVLWVMTILIIGLKDEIAFRIDMLHVEHIMLITTITILSGTINRSLHKYQQIKNRMDKL